MKRLLLVLFAICTLSHAQEGLAHEQWPNRPIKLIVPFPAGGNTDAVARIAAVQLQSALRVGVVIQNRGGAGGIVRTDAVAKAVPDRHTLLIFSIGSTTTPPATEP